ncbi:uncharacterized protein N7515_010168 [Penicillium bovifimosum]|uniref:Uncharacterized protein n=1 Tax=Penicillium bovifimosum TaxID=126998 RepID=A0A9W9GHZ3_9EURO|nr:uncharacterized protein N7515_010168 [Penicillium bovifimosum]KAJ5120780.1 hypothetical protein N7515_010168 [Penicillium bovifimosum]
MPLLATILRSLEIFSALRITPIHFKESVKDIPVFRRAEYEKDASKAAGFREGGSLYKYRKGAAVNLRHLDEYSRNIIIGHRKGGTFAYYVSVRDNTQSALWKPRRAMLYSNCLKHGLEKNLELAKLKQARKALREELIGRVRAVRKRLYDDTKKTMYDELFGNIRNQIIEQNHRGKLVKFKLETSYIQLERRVLTELEFKNRDIDSTDDTELVEDRIKSLELRLRLYKLNFSDSIQESKESFTDSTESSTSLKCLVCLGRSNIDPRVRRYLFCRKDAL